ncbi:hypothetical protein SADUNF_Sadunf01G0104500 [Salix dunnii]|uniref:Small EDRK-rich factor-like N-terminal domain-containing protein n=1 Tax=Salix dunnii TaxID=1413687 RepID=A0A835NB38_9ROSI|nr:hypothetical protein SADUNF_Sadunf01G0104500 [Salix dunnii]
MTRGKQKIEAQRKNAERNQKSKGSQFEARAVALKVTCPICKVTALISRVFSFSIRSREFEVQLANSNQLGDHYASKHPKEKPPAESS